MSGGPKGRTELIIGGSGAKNCAEHHGNVRFCVAPQKPTKNCKKPILKSNFLPNLTIAKKLDFNICFFVIFGRFLRSYAKTDVTMMFSAIFRSRSTYYQLCTTLGAPKHVPNTSEYIFQGFLAVCMDVNETIFQGILAVYSNEGSYHSV